ncbi:MAG: ComEC/Rec2 family competence protein [Schleiferiaceae bacterium]
MVVAVMLGMWLGALGVVPVEPGLGIAGGISLLLLGAGVDAVAPRRFWNVHGRFLRQLGLVLLAAVVRTPFAFEGLDVPRRTEGWFWTEGQGIWQDSVGLRYRSYDTISEGFAYRLRVELTPLDTALAPWAFDAARAAAPRRITARARVAARLGRVPVDRPWWRRAAAWGRARLDELPWGPAARGLAQALWLGDLEDLPDAVRHGFQNLGLAHVLAVSGFHLGLLWGLGTALGRWVPPRWRRMWSWAVLGAVWAFVAVVGFSPSSVRAASMLSVAVVARPGAPRGLDVFALAQIVLLAGDPALAHQLGFQLSSVAVLGLLLAAPADAVNSARTRWGTVLAGMKVSLAAQWATLGLSLATFHVLPWAFLASNVLLVPVLLLVYPYSLLAMLGLPLPDPEPWLHALTLAADRPFWIWGDRFPSVEQQVLLAVGTLGGLLGLRLRRPVRVLVAGLFTLAVLAVSGPRIGREQRWVAVGRGLACVQVRADTATIYGTKYLIENEFIWDKKLNNYFKSRGVRVKRYHVRPWAKLQRQYQQLETSN